MTFGYDEHVVLDRLSFQVLDGDQVTLAGRTGAGKSTIMKLLLGLYKPQKGSVTIHGVPSSEIREKTGGNSSAMWSSPSTWCREPSRDQITLYDKKISEKQVRAAAALTGLSGAIESLEKGYDTVCTPELFSQGQWQLLSIARAAAAEPHLLLLDEITANLDAETEKEVLDALKRVSENRTVISISHRTSAKMGRILQI